MKEQKLMGPIFLMALFLPPAFLKLILSVSVNSQLLQGLRPLCWPRALGNLAQPTMTYCYNQDIIPVLYQPDLEEFGVEASQM